MKRKSVEMIDIEKYFPGVKALDFAQLTLYEGEVMALLGENGAGKSTLMKILSGVHQKDGGTIKLYGEEIDSLTPKTAQDMGISIIHQELNLCTHLSVAENIFLGREIIRNGVNNERAMVKEAQRILDELGVDIKANDFVGDLSVSKQQTVEIAKALSMKSKVLIMDEPTSSLSFKEIEDLFRIINKLKNEGTSIVYISHRLEELKHIVDRVTIMRDAKFITAKEFGELSTKEIISYMVGREITEQFPTVETPLGDVVLEVKNLSAGVVDDVSFELRSGEIVGVGGLVGAGRTEMTRALFGIDKKDAGEILLDGKAVTINSAQDSIKHGIVLAPEDRKKDGLCTKLSIRENISLPNLDILSNIFGVVHRRKEKQVVDDSIKNLSIKLASAEADADSLSGGNQQKVVVAKWLARSSRVVVFDEPTRGIDVAAKVEIYNLMNELKKEGVAVLFVSSEMPEVLGVSDRILVMCDGRITANLNTKDTNQEEIMEYASSFREKKEVEVEYYE